MPKRTVRRSLSRPPADAVSVRSYRCASPRPLGHHSFGSRSRSWWKASGAKTTSRLSPAFTVTVFDTRTPWKAAVTVVRWSAESALRTGTTTVTSATDRSGRPGSTVSTRGSPRTRCPVARSRTWFQMPAARSRTAGIQSQPEAAR